MRSALEPEIVTIETTGGEGGGGVGRFGTIRFDGSGSLLQEIVNTANALASKKVLVSFFIIQGL